ncbi:hypothetical protein Tco_1284193 [Tanacetum coccineum]
MQQPQPNNNYNLQPSFNQNYIQQPMPNPEDITDPTTAMNMALVLMAKAFKLNYSTPTNNNHRISSNPCNRQIAQSGMNLGQDRHMQMVGGNEGNQFRHYVGQNVGNQNEYNAVQNVKNQNGNGNVVATQVEGDAVRNNGDLDEIEEVNAHCILMANFKQASTSGTQTDKTPVYDSDESAEVQLYDNCYNNDIFNMFTQEEQYTELLEPIPKPHQVQQNESNVISEVSSVEQEAAKFVRDFQSLAKEADESLAKHKALELEIERLLRAIVSQDILSNVQNPTVVENSISRLSLNIRKNDLKIVSLKRRMNMLNFGMIGVDNTAKTRRPQPRSNTKNVRVTSASKSSRIKNKEVEVEEHHRNLLLPKNEKRMSSECNNVKLAI